MQATVTLKGSTAEVMTLAFCADIAVVVMEGMAQIAEGHDDHQDMGKAVWWRVANLLGAGRSAGDYGAMIRQIQTATAELPPVRFRVGPVQMPLPETHPAELESDDPEGMTIKVEEIEGPDVAELAEKMAEAGLDVMVIQGVTAETMDLDAAHAAAVEEIEGLDLAELTERFEEEAEAVETKVTAAEFTQVLDAEAVAQLRWLRAHRGRVLHRWVDNGRALCGRTVRSGIAPVEPGDLWLPHCKGCERVTEETK